MDAIKNWIGALSQAQRGKLVIAIAGLLAVGYWFVSQPVVEVQLEEAPVAVSFSGVVQVHVVGEVAQPGLYELALGSRVKDAVSAAGGFLDQAIQHSVNLARVVSDGEQIVVLGPQDISSADSTGLISINRSNPEQLDRLPGVGPALAARIIELRTQLGSFSDIRQLREVSGIGEKLFASIKDLVTL